jgi:hypothetical protein
MDANKIYTNETGKIQLKSHYLDSNAMKSVDGDYLKWLKNMVEFQHEPSILKWIKTMFEHAEAKKWFEIYFSIDVHGTISKPDYRRIVKGINYYPYAKETLQLLSDREDIILLMSTSSYPDEIKIYNNQFKKDNIKFKYINENPEISSDKGSFGYYKDKFYFNSAFDDKSGFDPHRDWKFLYEYFSTTKYRPEKSWNMKYKETYHND